MHSYSAILIHPFAAAGRCSGSLRVLPSTLQFESADFKHEISLDKLSIRVGGAGNRFIFFTEKSRQDVSIYTSEKSILKDPVLNSHSGLTSEIAGSKKTLRKNYSSGIFLLGFIILFVAGIYFFKNAMVEKLAEQVPKSWEQAAGEQLFNTLSFQYKLIKNDSLKREFLKVGAPLFKQIEKKGYKIDLHFVNDPTINAFALPGGKVVVQTGLIENAKSWEEVMGVMGHELAHVTRRHHVRGVINNIGLYAVLAALLGDISALAGTFAELGGNLASLSNSRAFETEADETGWDYLVKAKMNPAGLISFFNTLEKQRHTKLDSLTKSVDLSFLSTHPDTKQRIKHLKEKQKDLKKTFIRLPDNFKTFQAKISEIK